MRFFAGSLHFESEGGAIASGAELCTGRHSLALLNEVCASGGNFQLIGKAPAITTPATRFAAPRNTAQYESSGSLVTGSAYGPTCHHNLTGEWDPPVTAHVVCMRVDRVLIV